MSGQEGGSEGIPGTEIKDGLKQEHHIMLTQNESDCKREEPLLFTHINIARHSQEETCVQTVSLKWGFADSLVKRILCIHLLRL